MTTTMDWDDPRERLRLAEEVGPREYDRLAAAHVEASVVERVNGHAIRPAASRFGRLWVVGATGAAFQTMEGAREHARRSPPG